MSIRAFSRFSRDLPADGSVGQAELHSRFGIAARSSSDLEDAQSVERKGAPHRSVRKFDGLCEKKQIYTMKTHEYSFEGRQTQLSSGHERRIGRKRIEMTAGRRNSATS